MGHESSYYKGRKKARGKHENSAHKYLRNNVTPRLEPEETPFEFTPEQQPTAIALLLLCHLSLAPQHRITAGTAPAAAKTPTTETQALDGIEQTNLESGAVAANAAWKMPEVIAAPLRVFDHVFSQIVSPLPMAEARSLTRHADNFDHLRSKIVSPFQMVEPQSHAHQANQTDNETIEASSISIRDIAAPLNSSISVVSSEMTTAAKLWIFSDYEKLKNIFSKKLFPKKSIFDHPSWQIALDELPRLMFDPDIAFISIKNHAKNRFKKDQFSEMIEIAQKIEQFSALGDNQSIAVKADIQNCVNKLQALFEQQYPDSYPLDQFLSLPNISEKLSVEPTQHAFNNAVEFYQNTDFSALTNETINAKNIKFVPYVALFYRDDKNFKFKHELIRAGSTNPGLSKLKIGVKIALAQGPNSRSWNLPIDVSSQQIKLAAQRDSVDRNNGSRKEISNLKHHLSFLKNSKMKNDFSWIFRTDINAIPDDKFWKNENSPLNLTSGNFPTIEQMATDALKKKFKEKLNLEIDPNAITLYHFNTQIWESGQLQQANVIASDSSTLTERLLRNVEVSTTDRIGVDENSWGFYPNSYQPSGAFDTAHSLKISPLGFMEMVREMNFYNNIYIPALDAYWNSEQNNKSEELRNARTLAMTLHKSDLTEVGKNVLLRGFGLFTDNSTSQVTVSLFDIHGSTATDMLVFQENSIGKIVLYMPRAYCAREFPNVQQLRAWIDNILMGDQKKMITNHFGLSDLNDSILQTGLRKRVENKTIDPNAIWAKKKVIKLQVLEAIKQRQKERMYSESDLLIKSNNEVYRDAMIDYFKAVDSVFPDPVGPFITLSLDIFKVLAPDNDEELAQAEFQTESDIANILVMVVFDASVRLSAANFPDVEITNYLKEGIADSAKIGQSHAALLAGDKANFNTPIKITLANSAHEVPHQYVEIYEANKEHFYSYHDPATSEQHYLLYNDEDFIDIESGNTWQPRHYDVTEIKTWKTGIDPQPYAPFDQFFVDDRPLNSVLQESLQYDLDHGAWMPPVTVTGSPQGLKVVAGHEMMAMAKSMRLEKIPYEFHSRKNLRKVTFKAEELYVPPRPMMKQSQLEIIADFKTKIQTEFPEFNNIVNNLKETSEHAVKKLAPHLKQMPGITNVRLGNMGIWEKAFENDGGLQSHFVVFATYKGQRMAIDLTPAQFQNWNVEQPFIIDSEYEWAAQMRSYFDKYPSMLVKFQEITGGPANAKFSSSSMLGPFDYKPNVKMLSPAKWYNEEVFEQIKDLKIKSVAAKMSSRKKLGTASNDGKLILDENTSQSKTKIYKKNIAGKFNLYRSSRPAKRLYLTAHGGFKSSTISTSIPENIKLDFLGPHGRYLNDPGIEFINDDDWLPFATVDKSGYKVNEYKYKSKNSQYHASGNPISVQGVDRIGEVMDYEIGRYGGGEYRDATKEDTKSITNAIDNNRKKTTGTYTDVLTVKGRFFWQSSLKLSDVFDMIRNNPDFSRYEEVIFSACRGDMNAKEEVGYSAKNLHSEYFVAQRTKYGWSITPLFNQGSNAGPSPDKKTP